MLEQRLHQKLLQKLSPQQIQLIKLLELPTLEFEQRIKKELEENPVLEEENENFEDYDEDNDIPAYKLKINNYSKDKKNIDIPFSDGISLHEHLLNQINLIISDKKQLVLAKYIIGSIDNSGYLRRKVESIVDDMAFSLNIITSDEAMSDILKIVQTLDPAGVGAIDLKECLLLQILRKSQKKQKNKNAKIIISDYFDEFSKKHYSKIAKKIGISEDELKKAVGTIIKLNPKPGNVFSSSLNRISQHITPDFIFEIIDDYFVLNLNSRNVPNLTVNKTYSNILRKSNKKNKRTKNDRNAVVFIKQKVDSAKWFIDAIKQRQNTLLSTMNAIISYQKDYFIEGNEMLMRPMILKDIAEITGLDISTISRVANSKYIQTHFGILPLKFFFSEGMETNKGGQVSTREIKKILMEFIDNEDKNKPYTDKKLSKILQDKGYLIARRTVAKYREQLGILVARLRKEL